MISSKRGIPTSVPEVTHVSAHGIWLLSDDREFFLSFDDFPWFKDASIGKISNVEKLSSGHFYWPDLDVDIGIETIQQPDKFPLKAR